jgi:hypothetical protein
MRDDGVQDRPDRGHNPEPRGRDDWDRDDLPQDVPFPKLVSTAGIMWIVAGGVILVDGAIKVLSVLMLGSAVGRGAGAFFTGAVCGAGFIAFVGGAFLFVGVQSVRGTAADTLGNGVGSIILGALVLGLALIALLVDPLVAGINLVSAGGLITAGVLALVGRGDYKLWKRSQGRRRF